MLAKHSGVVRSVRTSGSRCRVSVENPDGSCTYYLCQESACAPGDKLKEGKVVGYVEQTR